MSKLRIILGALVASLMLVGVTAGPASAQPRQQGLVNVNVTDVNVQIPIGVAANVCGVAVNVLAGAADLSQVDCEAEGVALAENDGNGNGSGPRQRGLVNVNLTDVNVQVPVSVAANICGVTVNVLAQAVDAGSVDCEALAESGASN